MDLNYIALALLTTFANALALVVWNLLQKARKDIERIDKEIAILKYNYLDRFDDIKSVLQTFELNVMQRIAILETLINKKGT